MKKLILLPLLLCAHVQIIAQDISFRFFNKETSKPIEYFSLFTNNEEYIGTSNINGEIKITNKHLEDEDTLIFFHVSYNREKLLIKELKDSNFLENKVNSLQEVTVSAERIRYRTKKVGGVRKNGGRSIMRPPNECGNYFEHQWKDKSVKIKSFNVYINDYYFDPGQKFRIHIYRGFYNDSIGEDLLQKNVYGSAKKGNEWVEIELEAEELLLPKEGIIAVIEVLGSQKSDLEFQDYLEKQIRNDSYDVPTQKDSLLLIETYKNGLSIPITKECNNCPEKVRAWSRISLGYWQKARYFKAYSIYMKFLIEK